VCVGVCWAGVCWLVSWSWTWSGELEVRRDKERTNLKWSKL